MKQSTTFALSILWALSSAMPLERRQDITVTTTADIVETVDVVVTVWLPPGGKLADQDQQKPQNTHQNKPNPAPVIHTTPVEDVAIHTQTSPPVAQQVSHDAAQSQANQAQEQTNQAQAAKNQAAQEQSIQAQNQANQAQEKANDDKAAQNKAAQNQIPPAPKSSPPKTPAAAPIAATVGSPAASPATQDSSSSDQTQPTSGDSCGNVGGTCTAANVTYYGGGLGACGWSNDTTSEDFFALAHGCPPPPATLPAGSLPAHKQCANITIMQK